MNEFIVKLVPAMFTNRFILDQLTLFKGMRVESSMVVVDVDADPKEVVCAPRYCTDASKRTSRFKDQSER